MVEQQRNAFSLAVPPPLQLAGLNNLPTGMILEQMAAPKAQVPPSAGNSLAAAQMYEGEVFGHPAANWDSDHQSLDVHKLILTRGPSSNFSQQQWQTPNMVQQESGRDGMNVANLMSPKAKEQIHHGVQETIATRAVVPDAGIDSRIIPSNGLPLSGIGSISYGMEHQILNSLDQMPNLQQQQLVQTLAAPQQRDSLPQAVAQAQGQTKPALPKWTRNSSKPMLPKSHLRGKDGRISRRQKEEQRAMASSRQRDKQKNMLPMRQTAERPQIDQLKQQQSRESGGFDAVHKTSEDCLENFLYLGDGDTDVANSFTIFRQSSSACETEQKDFSFEEVGSIHASESKVLCCHFSSNGRLVASAGNERKILIWNTQTFDFSGSSEGHSNIITDVRFKPYSNILASSSFDKTVQIWDATKPKQSLCNLHGHLEHVTSVDFHPKNFDILCSCDANNEIRLWSVHQSVCMHVTKGADRQVRFQPRAGNLLAATSGNIISLIDLETYTVQNNLKGHNKDVLSICWDTSGKYIASVSEESARIWSVVSGGKCVYELRCSGNKFQSCAFHPGYSQLLVIGSYQSIELWNPTQNERTKSVHAHNGIIAAIADSPQNEMMASASHDQWVKLWK